MGQAQANDDGDGSWACREGQRQRIESLINQRRSRISLFGVGKFFVAPFLQQAPARDGNDKSPRSAKDGDRDPVKAQNKGASQESTEQDAKGVHCNPPRQLTAQIRWRTLG